MLTLFRKGGTPYRLPILLLLLTGNGERIQRNQLSPCGSISFSNLFSSKPIAHCSNNIIQRRLFAHNYPVVVEYDGDRKMGYSELSNEDIEIEELEEDEHQVYEEMEEDDTDDDYFEQMQLEDEFEQSDAKSTKKHLSPAIEKYFMRILDRIEHEEKYAERPMYRAHGITPLLFKMSFEIFSRHFMHEMVFDNDVRKAFIKLNRRSSNNTMTEYDLMYKMYLQDVMQRFPSHFLNQQEKLEDSDNVTDLLSTIDMKKPHDWYPAARQKKRKIIAHTGPTNSGKTHSAFERLRQASHGIYCAPLRLLATEGYVKLTDQGVKCNLVTGDYKIEVDGATHSSSTVEMVDINRPVDVAVIDEIQLIGDEDRGWAWTRVLLGINADEVHVCGEERALKLIKQLCEETGDELEVKTYKRLTPLKITAKSSIMGTYRNIKQGDCVVAFSRKEVFKIKHEIESLTRFKVAVVYGSLPPKVRLEQSRLFNSENSKYDVLVATDAIGMGLNLNIRRLIFHSMEKFDGTIRRELEPWEIRQIAGRAGRYGSLYPNGEVTCLRDSDCKILQNAFRLKSLPDIESAGLFPPIDQIEYFTRQFSPDQKLSIILDSFYKLTETDNKYFMCNIESQRDIANLLHDIKDLTFHERMLFLNAPIDTADPNSMRVAKIYARTHAKGVSVPLIVELPEKYPQNIEQLREVESIYKILDVYCWLSYRYPETFVNSNEARNYQSILLDMIQKAINKPVNRTFLLGNVKQIHSRYNNMQRRVHRKEMFRRERERLMQELEEYGIINEYYKNRRNKSRFRRHDKRNRYK
jgi:ATP-dependent RNA helicase SUPV3L1/SUV3